MGACRDRCPPAVAGGTSLAPSVSGAVTTVAAHRPSETSGRRGWLLRSISNSLHLAPVDDDQLVVPQLLRARTAVAVVSVGAKFMPVRVTLAVTAAWLYGEDAVMTGAGRTGEALLSVTRLLVAAKRMRPGMHEPRTVEAEHRARRAGIARCSEACRARNASATCADARRRCHR